MMRRIISIISLCLCLGLSARAQVFILNDNVFQGRMSEIKTTVKSARPIFLKKNDKKGLRVPR